MQHVRFGKVAILLFVLSVFVAVAPFGKAAVAGSVADVIVVNCASPPVTLGNFNLPIGFYEVAVTGVCQYATFNGPVGTVNNIPCVTGVTPCSLTVTAPCYISTGYEYTPNPTCVSPAFFDGTCHEGVVVDGQCVTNTVAAGIFHNNGGPVTAWYDDCAGNAACFRDNTGYFVVTITEV
jgi:hypothetical protein